MYCPKCGQSPGSGEVQFCTRCGLSLKVVKELIVNDAVVPAKYERPVQGIAPSQRQKGTRLGAKLVFWGIASAPVTLLFGLLVDSPFLFFLSLLIVFIGTVRILYARLFEEAQSSTKPDVSARLRHSSLPKSDVLPVSPNSFSPSAREISPPHSVTEHTTKLLDS
jgi:hypothetical protein